MKPFNFKVVLGLVAGAIVLGVLNNFRVPQEHRVSWFGGQQILVKPAEE